MPIIDLSGIPSAILKTAEDYWDYWWVLLLIIIGAGIYIVYMGITGG